jgi:hypothetical protein
MRLRLAVNPTTYANLVGGERFTDSYRQPKRTNEWGQVMFTRSGATWSQQAELSTSDPAADDGFGCNLALSGDTALIGAAGKTVSGQSDAGAACAHSTTATSLDSVFCRCVLSVSLSLSASRRQEADFLSDSDTKSGVGSRCSATQHGDLQVFIL